MEITEVETRVKQAIARVLQMDVAEINSDSNFIFDLGADSQQSVELVAHLLPDVLTPIALGHGPGGRARRRSAAWPGGLRAGKAAQREA